MDGFTLMLFIYWGWDTAVSVNEETKERDKIPGRAAVTSTFVLLVDVRRSSSWPRSRYAGIGTHGIGLENPNHAGDVLSVLGTSIFGTSGFGQLPDQAAAADGAELGRRLDPDHHSADGADDAVDGGVQGHPELILQRSTSGS